MISENFVVVSTVHPVAGRLYLKMILESSVGLPGIYLVTDSLDRCVAAFYGLIAFQLS